MTPRSRRIAPWLVLCLMVAAGCQVPFIDRSEEAAAAVREQDLGAFPYHPIVFHLDLAILAYQLYGQTLAWPFDPYYEEAGEGRPAMIERVREWVASTAAAQADADPGLEAFRGPGALGGFDDNPAHDPIVYQYSRLHPWSDTLTLPGDRFTEYRTPRAITSRIAEAWLCTRTAGVAQADQEERLEGTVTRHALPMRRDDAAPDASDVLLVFEGGTGDKGEPDQPASQSVMGYALVRDTGGGAYDVHIAFRGSRSGSASRAAREALSTREAGGNPDWITDLGFREEARALISAEPGHEISRGMATSMASILPQLFDCLDMVGEARATAPTNIYVTGHSLGGALAQQLTSAVLLGDRYGPGGDLMPASLRGWPWANIKMITFGAPRVGNAVWAKTLTLDHLDSIFYYDQAAPFDGAGVGVTDLEIIPRVLDPGRPAAYRVLIPSDPITTDLLAGGAHVGHTVYLEEGDTLEIVSHADFEAHEPINERMLMTDTLRDERIPETAWVYHETADLVPTRDVTRAGTVEQYQLLIDAIRDYYPTHDLFFDTDAYDASATTFLSLVSE